MDPTDPTNSQFAAYRAMWDYFNVTLFGSALRKVFLNFSRRARSLGFFAPKRWESGNQVTHEISLNPTHLKRGSARDMASTLVHEMVHLWQYDHGKPKRPGYHDEQWARKMEELGLPPSSTGAPGGKRVGYKMSHYILESGPFARAFDVMPAEYCCPGPAGSTKMPSKARVR
jgi:predicted SprT family Zn-dependent metalloprotease